MTFFPTLFFLINAKGLANYSEVNIETTWPSREMWNLPLLRRFMCFVCCLEPKAALEEREETKERCIFLLWARQFRQVLLRKGVWCRRYRQLAHFPFWFSVALNISFIFALILFLYPLYLLVVSMQCHACSCNWRQPASEEEEVPTCPQCGGEFVERISLGVAARPPPVAISSELLRQVCKLS